MNAKENSTLPAKNTSSSSNPKLYGKIVLTLQNCLLPEEKLNSTPSYLDGLDAETETDLRILGCELIQTAGILLKLPQVSNNLTFVRSLNIDDVYLCKRDVIRNSLSNLQPSILSLIVFSHFPKSLSFSLIYLRRLQWLQDR